MLKKFHVCVQVSDIQLWQSFYQQLGFTPVAELQHEDNNVVWQYLSHPNTDVLMELLQFKDASEVQLNPQQRQNLGG